MPGEDSDATEEAETYGLAEVTDLEEMPAPDLPYRPRDPDSYDPGIALIGTGGILAGEDAAEKMRLGADLVQFYTGFVYRGPDLVNDCLNAIKDLGHA